MKAVSHLSVLSLCKLKKNKYHFPQTFYPGFSKRSMKSCLSVYLSLISFYLAACHVCDRFVPGTVLYLFWKSRKGFLDNYFIKSQAWLFKENSSPGQVGWRWVSKWLFCLFIKTFCLFFSKSDFFKILFAQGLWFVVLLTPKLWS